MDADETDATPRENDYNPPSEHGDSVEWAAIDSYRSRTPPDHEDVWTIRSISRRFAHGERAANTVESPTGESVTLSEPHRYVTVTRDRFPHTRTVMAEYKHYVFSDVIDLTAWFDEDEALVR